MSNKNKLKIKLAYITDNGVEISGFEDSCELQEFISKKKHSFESISSISGMEFIDFTVTNEIDKENLDMICYGRLVSELFDMEIDFHDSYYQSWHFVQHKGKYINLDQFFKKKKPAIK